MDAKTLYPELFAAADHARLKVIGHQQVTDYAQAAFLTTLIRAYGSAPHGFIYAEPTLPGSELAPDGVLLHPETGIIVFEVKAYDLSYIQGIEAGNLQIWQGGQVVSVNPLRQAQRSMYAIKELYEQMALDFARPLFNAMVVLPNIHESEWIAAGYENAIQRRIALFAEECASIEKMQARIARQVHQTLTLSGLSDPMPPSTQPTLTRIFGQSAVLKPMERKVHPLHVENLGQKIAEMETAHRALSLEQQQLVRLETWGHPFLLRGVAGSGKSLVMAYHAAWAVLRHEQQHQQLTLFPEDRHLMPKIAVSTLNRSLIPFLKERIESAYFEITGKRLPPDVLAIQHLNGLFYQLAQQHAYFHYLATGNDMAAQARDYMAQLDRLSESQLNAMRFDALFLDEGQDIHPEMFILLNRLIRPDRITGERTISIYYDDAQNIYGHPHPIWSTFGMNVEGGRAAFMQQCYRNSREIIELGLNVLLGTAADEKTRVQTRRYADIYTLQEKGLAQEGSPGWRVTFAEESGEVPQVRVFQTRAEQTDWIAAGIVQLIEDEQVRPEDILILARSGTVFPLLEQTITRLSHNRINFHTLGARNRTAADEALIQPGHVTLSTIYAAKGYDAPIAMLMDVDQIETNVVGRSLFYVGATRAKRFLIVTGVKKPHSLLDEAQAVHHRLFEQ